MPLLGYGEQRAFPPLLAAFPGDSLSPGRVEGTPEMGSVVTPVSRALSQL